MSATVSPVEVSAPEQTRQAMPSEPGAEVYQEGQKSLKDPKAKPPIKRQNSPVGPKAMADKLKAAIDAQNAAKNPPEAPVAPQKEAAEAPVPAKNAPPAKSGAEDLLAQYIAEQQKAQKAAEEATKRETAAAAREAAAKALLEQANAKTKQLENATENPVEFISQLGWTEEEWKNFLTSGGKLTSEQKKLREMAKQQAALEKKLADMQASQQQQQQAVEYQSQLQTINQGMSKYPITSRLGGAVEVLKMVEANKRQGKHMSWEQAAGQLEAMYKTNLTNLLKEQEVSATLGLNSVEKPKSDSAAQKVPTTLGRQTAGTSAPSQRPSPKDWTAKKKLYLELLAAQRS
jgi:hypothetical protein